jgi:hypothetical protein
VITVVAPRFDLAHCNTEQEREFIEALHRRAIAGGWYADSWLRRDRVIFSVCRIDTARNCVTRTLRVDFDGAAIIFGDDETHQFVTDLDPAKGATIVKGRPIAELAGIAADWLERKTWSWRAYYFASVLIVWIAAGGLVSALLFRLAVTASLNRGRLALPAFVVGCAFGAIAGITHLGIAAVWKWSKRTAA